MLYTICHESTAVKYFPHISVTRDHLENKQLLHLGVLESKMSNDFDKVHILPVLCFFRYSNIHVNKKRISTGHFIGNALIYGIPSSFWTKIFHVFCSREMAGDPSVFTGFEMRKMAKIISPKDSLVVLHI